MDTSSVRVAVIGAGPAGLAAMKSLREEGFQVTAFERRSAPGGLWTLSDEPDSTSVTPGTKFQLSRFVSPYTDYPMPDDFPRHPTAEHMSSYFRSYAKRFDLEDLIVFNSRVSSVRRRTDDRQWLLQLESEPEPRAFDKVILAAGAENTPKMPVIEGLELFQGRFLHGQAYKRASDFKGQRVVVLGQGNSAADCAVELVPHASKVYMAHRRGALVIPRNVDGRAFDSFASWKLTRMLFFLGRRLPALHRLILYLKFSRTAGKAWRDAGGEAQRSHRFGGELAHANNIAAMIVNDELVPLLRKGAIASVHGIRRVAGPRTLEMDDGEVLEDVDAIIACTGYHASMDVLGGAVEYVQHRRPQSGNGAHQSRSVPPVPRLYRNVFPPRWADSLACLNYIVLMESAVLTHELAAMAVAQVWAGKSALPGPGEMEAQAEAQARWFARRVESMPVTQHEGLVDAHGWLRWADGAAGTGVHEHLGWGWKGWRFALTEPRLYFLMAWGVNSPHIYRVFETGKRKAWRGAREAILHVNEESAMDKGRGG